MIYLTKQAEEIPYVYEIAIGAYNHIKNCFNDIPESILIDVTKDTDIWGQRIAANNDNAIIEISEDYKQCINGLYDTLIHELLHTCKACNNIESDNHKGEWLQRAKLLGIEIK